MSDTISRLNSALEGRYFIERELGEGGMSTVYLAEDVRHGRKVAIKVLKPELAAIVGAERFLAEIKVTANLHHPHILPLHDSGEADGFLFYVMPQVEGESLRARLRRQSQLPVEEAVEIATRVAGALRHAHERGVIHRDIKPANILMQDGEPMVADFGIALAMSAAGGDRLTETGLSLGTPYYMSPEQATGDQEIGPASDIYALACVLYEMLVGDPPFMGSTAQAVLSRILAGDVSAPSKQRSTIPANVDAAIRKALERSPADRFRGAQDFARALADPGFRHGAEEGSAAAGRPPRLWNPLSIGMTAVAGGALLVAGWAVRRPEARPIARFDLGLAVQRGIQDIGGVELALSSDGAQIAYVGVLPNGATQIWRRSLDDLEPHLVEDTELGASPVFSPDGASIAFESGGGIKTVSLLGGAPFTVVSHGRSPFWGSDGRVYYSANAIYAVSEGGGGQPEEITSPRDAVHDYPSVLPNGAGVLISVLRGNSSRIAVVEPDGGEVREILTGTMARYAASGHLVYATLDGQIMAAPFDLGRLEVTGPSVALVDGVQVKGSSASEFALSQSGTLIYKTGSPIQYELVWVGRDGAVEPVDPGWTGDFRYPALSPDGRRLAVGIEATPRDIWVKQLDRGPSLKLTFEGSINDYATWTPDGESVTFYSDRAGDYDLWTKRADGSSRAELTLDLDRRLLESLWSPDAAWLIYRTGSSDLGSGDILAIRPGVDTTSTLLVATEFSERMPALSPDGGWLAYVSNESGRDEVYVVPFPNTGGGRWVVSSAGGTGPVWARNGRELFYRTALGDLVALQVETEPTFSTGQLDVLFDASAFRLGQNSAQYDVSADGQRFIMLREIGTDVTNQVVLVQNFFEELRTKVGEGG